MLIFVEVMIWREGGGRILYFDNRTHLVQGSKAAVKIHTSYAGFGRQRQNHRVPGQFRLYDRPLLRNKTKKHCL